MSKKKNREFLEHFVENSQTEPTKTKTTQNTENPEVVDRKRNWALFRYIAIMFCVAFVLVFMSLYFTTRRDSQQTISQLNQNANSALARAERLQDDNRELTETNAQLQERIGQLEEDLTAAQEQMEENDETISKLEEENKDLISQKGETDERMNGMTQAYSLLAQAQMAYGENRLEDCTTALDALTDLREYLDENSQMLYNKLLKELEITKEN